MDITEWKNSSGRISPKRNKVMAKLIMLSGLPASGKSTRAEELLRSMGNAVRVNKDLLRTMLHFDKFTGMNEGLTRDTEKLIAKTFLSLGINVVVDDTNLGQPHLDYWRNVAEETGSKFEKIDIDTDWVTCATRDAGREKKVGKDVIIQMAMQYGKMEPRSFGYVICDLDGTLANIEHRLGYVRERKDEQWAEKLGQKDWKEFFAHIAGDTLRQEVADMVAALYLHGCTIVLVSARPETYREETVKWLESYRIFSEDTMSEARFKYLTLIMRRAHDKRPDYEVKEQILKTYFKDQKIFKVFDDRPSVIRMWRANGLDVEDVGNGVDF